GTISLPLLNSVVAAGKSPEELRDEISRKYREQRLAYERLSDKTYRIAPNDVLEVRFRFRPDYTDRVTVRPDGRISLALVKSVVAAGKSPEELERELIARY